MLIAVAGTGGHVYPGIALAEELRARHPEMPIVFAGARGKPSSKWVERAGFPVREIRIRGFSRTKSLSWITFPFVTILGFFEALALLLKERPQLVVGTGGYVSGPFVAWAALLRIPTLLLEQNVVPGITSRWGARFAREIHVAVPETVARLSDKANARVSGNPVRSTLLAGDGARFRARHDVAESASVVLVLGGSQGAKSVTEAALVAARIVADSHPTTHFVIQAGPQGLREWQSRSVDVPKNVTLVAFLDEMGDAYAAADLVVSRAGAMTLAELSATATPAILVPYPYAAEDHQRTNAARFAATGGGSVIDPTELTGEKLADRINELFTNRTELSQMASAAKNFEAVGARERVADACEALLG